MSKLEGAWIPRKMRGIHAPVEAAAGPRCRFPEFFGREWKRHSICSRYMRAKVLVSWLSYFRVGLSRWRKTPRNKRKGKIMSELTRPVLFRVAVIAMALALSAVAQGQFNYTTNHGAITIAGYTGPGGAVYIPARIGGLPVTGIGVAAFEDCGSLTDITIPDGVTIIGDYAFAFCTFLTNVTIPNTVASIGSGAFYACSWLKSVAIPDSVTNLGKLRVRGVWPGQRHDPQEHHRHRRLHVPVLRPEQRCYPRQRYCHRGWCVLRQRPEERHDPQRCHQHRGLCILSLRHPDQRHDPGQRHQHRVVRILRVRQPEGCLFPG